MAPLNENGVFVKYETLSAPLRIPIIINNSNESGEQVDAMINLRKWT
jgi:flagellar assembly factor FliW